MGLVAPTILVSGRITFKVSIHCCSCGRQAFSRHSTEVSEVTASEMQDYLERVFDESTPDIPVGWSMSGRDRLLCEDCPEPKEWRRLTLTFRGESPPMIDEQFFGTDLEFHKRMGEVWNEYAVRRPAEFVARGYRYGSTRHYIQIR